MMDSIEMTQIDLRFERLRLKDPAQENRILCSIIEGGIKEPLQCVMMGHSGGETILLDGFKRYRCARKAGIRIVPVISLGAEEVEGIGALIRASNHRRLHPLEEASLLTELRRQHGLEVSDIADRVGRSLSWVRLRLGMLDGMSELVHREVFLGRFPLRSYMYALRPVTRVTSPRVSEVDEFVKATSAKGLSTRNLDLLAHAYFKGPKPLKEQIEQGNLDWTLQHLKDEGTAKEPESGSASRQEQIVLSDLERVQRHMGKVTYELSGNDLQKAYSIRCARVLVKRILDQVSIFIQTLRTFYDSPGHKKSD